MSESISSQRTSVRYRSRLLQPEADRHPDSHPLTWRLRDDGEVIWIDEYLRKEGYQSVRNALDNGDPQAIIATMKDANVRGRGGAGFSAGLKWSLTLQGGDMPRGYLICNADEMEPGTFKDRLLMEQQPHLLIEGMILGALANNSFYGYIFLRGEYVEAARVLNRALDEAREAGWLGASINGSGFDFDIAVHTGAGRYICGEETALINSLEGKRANPRAKPPFPGQSGAWGKPSVVNNVETLCNVPAVILKGADWYQALSGDRTDDGGSKLYGVSGPVEKPGLWELPMGTTGAEILERAGGITQGLAARRRQHRVSVAGASRAAAGFRHRGQRRQSSGDGIADGGASGTEHGGADAQPGGVFCAGILWLVHTLPGRAAVDGQAAVGTGTGAG